MTITSTAFMAAASVAGSNLDKIDCSDVLSAILLKDTALLGQIPMGSPANNIVHYWIEDSLNQATLKGMISASGGVSLSLEFENHDPNLSTTAEVLKVIRTGAIIGREGWPLKYYVVAPGSCTITVSVYGSLTLAAQNSANYSTTTRWFVVAQPYGDIPDASEDISKSRSRRANHLQIFERGIEIAQSREGIDMWAVPDELKMQIKYRTYEVKRELNMTALMGVTNTYSYSMDRRTMAGLIQLIRDYDLDGTNEDDTVSNAAGAALTLTKINDICKTMYDNGGFDDQSNCVLVVGPYQARVIALLEEGRIRKASNELVVGSYADKVKTDMGFDLPVIMDRFCPSDTLMILDKSRVKLIPLSGDAWALEKMAKTGRRQKYQLSGQYTIELRAAQACHGLIFNLAWS